MSGGPARPPAGGETVLLLGSNKGRRVRAIRDGLCAISEKFDIIRLSRFYAGEPRGRGDQPWFLNVAVAGHTALSPDGLLALAKEVEGRAGRGAGPRWGPRELDVDIILMGGRVVREPHLTIPHASMAERRFCLLPVSEIAPRAIVPPGGETVAELLEACTDTSEVFPI
jgi:2-amino-4-hydroxy-6-hydroxymethyldihydropteridine diphosphokinase